MFVLEFISFVRNIYMNLKNKQLSVKIDIIVISIMVLGLFSELIGLFITMNSKYLKLFLHIKGFTSSVNLHLFNRNTFFDNGLNFLNILFYSFILIGIIIFYSSRKKDTRLISFTMSVVLVSNIFYFLMSVIYLFIYLMDYYNEASWWIFNILYILKSLILGFISFFVIKQIKAAQNKEKVADISALDTIEYASVWQRFANYLIDSIICILIFSFYLFNIIYNSKNNDWIDPGNVKFIIYLSYFLFNVLYFLFFEIFFGSTPGKFLTQTSVIHNKGKNLNFKTIIIRSLSRHIPLEAFSFFGSSGGWHDILSNTSVIKEPNSGIRGSYYLWLIPFSLVLLIGLYLSTNNF